MTDPWTLNLASVWTGKYVPAEFARCRGLGGRAGEGEMGQEESGLMRGQTQGGMEPGSDT